MQGNFKLVFAHCFKRTFRQAHIGFFGLNTQSTDGFGNIGIGYRAEQATVHTGFLRDGNGLTVQLGFTRLGICQNGGLFRFQFSAARFKFFQIGFGGTLAFAVGIRKLRA